MNFIEELYYENISPGEKCFELNSNYAQALNTSAKNEEFLTEALEGKEKKQFLELIDAQGEVLGIASLESFVDGFRLGARFTLDTFGTGHERVLKDIF